MGHHVFGNTIDTQIWKVLYHSIGFSNFSLNMNHMERLCKCTVIQAVWGGPGSLHFKQASEMSRVLVEDRILRSKDLEDISIENKCDCVSDSPLFKLPDFFIFRHMLITSLLHNNMVHLKEKREKMHQACLLNTTVFYSMLSCQWK